MRRRDSKLTISNALIFYLFMGIVLPVCLFGMCFTLVMNHTCLLYTSPSPRDA